MKKVLRVLGVVALTFAVAAACGNALHPAGTRCENTDECAAGLACLPLATVPGAGCQTIATVCSKRCDADADCLAVGVDSSCFPACDGTGTCGRVE